MSYLYPGRLFMPNLGYGANGQYQMDRLNQGANAENYDPYLGGGQDDNSALMQSYAMQQRMLTQEMNAMYPSTMAPYNLGQGVGNFLGGILGGQPGQGGGPSPQQQQAQEAASNALRDQIHQKIYANMSSGMPFGQAMYQAAADAMRDPNSSPAMHKMAMQYIQTAVKSGYDPKQQKDQELTQENQRLANEKLKESLIQGGKSIMYDYDAKDQYGLRKMDPFRVLSRYDDNGNPDPDYNNKVLQAYKDARAAGLKNPQIDQADVHKQNQDRLGELRVALEQQKLSDQRIQAGMVDGQPDPKIVKGLNDYTIDPRTLNYRTRNMYIAAAKGADPNYDETQFPARSAQAKAFTASGAQGKAMISIDTAVQHVEAARRASEALDNGNLQLANIVANQGNIWSGKSAPTKAQLSTIIASDEAVRAVVGAQNRGGDRDRMESLMNTLRGSPEQNKDNFNELGVLLAGRLAPLKQQYEAYKLPDFEGKLTPFTRDVLGRASQANTQTPQVQPYQDASKEARYQAWKKAHGG